jgi:uncharacterized membrane protein
MAILGLLIWLPFNLILAIGLLIFFGHNLLDFAERSRQTPVPVLWSFLHQVRIEPLGGGHSLFIFYPFSIMDRFDVARLLLRQTVHRYGSSKKK